MIFIPRIIARIPILRGLFRLAISGYADLTRGRYLVENRLGLRLLLDRENTVDKSVFLSGQWEERSVKALFGLIEQARRPGEKAIFLDVGAHWGLYALLAHKTGHFERIVAFEPDPTNYAQLQANLFLNGVETAIEAVPLAASDAERTFGLYLRTHVNRGATTVVEADADAEAQVTCRAVRVDEQIDVEGRLLVIQIDVEGHELEAVDGLARLLAKNRCLLQIEIWDEPDGEHERRLAHLTSLFEAHGIKLVHAVWADHFFMSA